MKKKEKKGYLLTVAILAIFVGDDNRGSEGRGGDADLVLAVVDESVGLLEGKRGHLGTDLLDLLGNLGGTVDEGGGEGVGREVKRMLGMGNEG
ncbi:hypothetical protein Q3G72_002462 [Acer saccharum]|nr:hypothetical protein Q3G72_002462 [Acer saccharum]